MLRLLIAFTVFFALLAAMPNAHAQSFSADNSLSFSTQSAFAPSTDITTASDNSDSSSDTTDFEALAGTGLIAWWIDSALKGGHGGSTPGIPGSGEVGVAPELNPLWICLSLCALQCVVILKPWRYRIKDIGRHSRGA